MTHLRAPLRLPGPPTCTFCGADDAEQIVTGRHAFICDACVFDSHLQATPRPPACALCGHAFGTRHGFLWFRVRRLALARGAAAACQSCLHVAQRRVSSGKSRRARDREP